MLRYEDLLPAPRSREWFPDTSQGKGMDMIFVDMKFADLTLDYALREVSLKKLG